MKTVHLEYDLIASRLFQNLNKKNVLSKPVPYMLFSFLLSSRIARSDTGPEFCNEFPPFGYWSNCAAKVINKLQSISRKQSSDPEPGGAYGNWTTNIHTYIHITS